MFKNLFKVKYRIKKVSYPESSGGCETTYYLQYTYPLWPFWISRDYDSSEEAMRGKMRRLIFNSNRKKSVEHFYNVEPVPDHIPKGQRDKYLLEKEKQV